MTVQIPEDVKNKIYRKATIYAQTQETGDKKTIYDYERTAFEKGAEFGYSISQQQLASFRKKLENITIDELLKNTGIILELFDEHFGIKK